MKATNLNHQLWSTQKQDLEDAEKIMEQHLLMNEGEPLGFLEVLFYKTKNDENSVELRMPDWIIELQRHFADNYGEELGHQITSKVLTRFLLKNEIFH